jgi:signal peptidase II
VAGFNSKGLVLPVLIIGVVFSFSWWARETIIETLNLYEKIILIKNFFSITYIRNPGAAFGLFSTWNASFRLPFLIGVSFTAFLLIGYLLFKSRRDHWMMRTGLSLLAAGAAGNFYERLIYGEVVDYLDFYFRNYHWPTFNVSDVSISTGIGFILFCYYIQRKGENEHANHNR